MGLQVREGVRTEAEALALGRQVAACPGLHLRGVMTHHGRLDVFQPIVKAFKDTFGQVSGLGILNPDACPCKALGLQNVSSKLRQDVLTTNNGLLGYPGDRRLKISLTA